MTGPIRILHVFGKTNLGGAESRIMDLYRQIDRSRVQFDFLVHTEENCFFDQEIEKLGGRIYRVPRFQLYNYFSYKRALKAFFKEHHEFAAVQGHMTSTAAIYLPIAKKAGVKTTIAHARSAGVDQGMKGTVTRLLRINLWKRADYLFTCSRLAALSVFGKKAMEAGKPVYIPNAIDCQKFDYDTRKREEMRQALGLEGKYVIGHVGRFHYAKNHEYLIRVFAALCKRAKAKGCTEDFRLLLLGEGGTLEQIRELSRQLGVESQILFPGNKRNVWDYYEAMDYLVYPSRYEGLPGTVIEAQTCGLKCLISDSIGEEAVVTDLVECMSIQRAEEDWADAILRNLAYDRRGYVQEMKEAGFDVVTQTERMMHFYETGEWR